MGSSQNIFSSNACNVREIGILLFLSFLEDGDLRSIITRKLWKQLSKRNFEVVFATNCLQKYGDGNFFELSLRKKKNANAWSQRPTQKKFDISPLCKKPPKKTHDSNVNNLKSQNHCQRKGQKTTVNERLLTSRVRWKKSDRHIIRHKLCHISTETRDNNISRAAAS